MGRRKRKKKSERGINCRVRKKEKNRAVMREKKASVNETTR